MKIPRVPIHIIFISFIVFISSCDPNRIYEENLEMENAAWNVNDAKKFTFQISDTISLYNLYLNVRNTNDYAYQNLYLFVEMTSPSNKFFKDTVEMTLADNQGKWKGSGVGNIWSNRFPLLQNVKLLESGEYTVIVVQGMRHENLEAISDVGIRIEKSE